MQRLRLAIVILLLVSISFGQTSRRRHRKAAPPTPSMPSAKQSVEMKKLTDTFTGMWKTTATVEKNAFFPLAGTAEGRSDFRSGPSGNSLVERARSHGVMGTFAGLGLFWWDAKAAAYKAIWCDTLTPDGCDAMGTGHWDGNNLVFTSDTDTNGSTMHMRETYSAVTADSFTFTMEAAMGEAPMQKMMTILYQRSEPKTTVVAPSGNAEQTK
ncbi:MAG TPA: DUF1579 family protein [Terriglobales bacterium]|nr:DUF1579 family protein [Terriglobales bacterium]